jgi:hypothetical protein
MTRPNIFSHRPPSSGIYLLTDPFPERLNGSTSLFSRAESLSSQREFIAASTSQRLRVVTSAKK